MAIISRLASYKVAAVRDCSFGAYKDGNGDEDEDEYEDDRGDEEASAATAA